MYGGSNSFILVASPYYGSSIYPNFYNIDQDHHILLLLWEHPHRFLFVLRLVILRFFHLLIHHQFVWSILLCNFKWVHQLLNRLLTPQNLKFRWHLNLIHSTLNRFILLLGLLPEPSFQNYWQINRYYHGNFKGLTQRDLLLYMLEFCFQRLICIAQLVLQCKIPHLAIFIYMHRIHFCSPPLILLSIQISLVHFLLLARMLLEQWN